MRSRLLPCPKMRVEISTPKMIPSWLLAIRKCRKVLRLKGAGKRNCTSAAVKVMPPPRAGRIQGRSTRISREKAKAVSIVPETLKSSRNIGLAPGPLLE